MTNGDGALLHISAATSGKRNIKVNQHQMIEKVRYESFAQPLSLDKIRKPLGKQIALTFDNGPDPLYTSQILDILDRYNIKATFFVVGKNALDSPGLIRRIDQSGHDIGNKTYSYQDLTQVATWEEKLELNIDERIIQAFTGKTPTLFRMPEYTDSKSHPLSEVESLFRVQNYGYTLIGGKGDVDDWANQKVR